MTHGKLADGRQPGAWLQAGQDLPRQGGDDVVHCRR